MSGVCAGWRKKVGLGDVVIADRLWTYDTGKVVRTSEGEQVASDQHQFKLKRDWKTKTELLAPRWLGALDATTPWLAQRPLTTEDQLRWALRILAGGGDPTQHDDRADRCPNWWEVLQRLRQRAWVEPKRVALTDAGRDAAEELRHQFLPGARPGHNADGLPRPAPFRWHLGAMASGSKVVEDPTIFTRLSAEMRKIHALEMEGAAVATVAMDHGLPFVVAKGVQDFADGEKDDQFRAFAARASAEWVVWFLRQMLTGTAGRATADRKGDEPTPPGVGRPPAQRWLGADWLQRLHDAALSCGWYPSARDLLFSYVPTTWVAQLDRHGAPAMQLTADLDALNATPAIAGADVPPFESWLQRAAGIAHPRMEAQVFEEALATVRAERARRAGH